MFRLDLELLDPPPCVIAPDIIDPAELKLPVNFAVGNNLSNVEQFTSQKSYNVFLYFVLRELFFHVFQDLFCNRELSSLRIRLHFLNRIITSQVMNHESYLDRLVCTSRSSGWANPWLRSVWTVFPNQSLPSYHHHGRAPMSDAQLLSFTFLKK